MQTSIPKPEYPRMQFRREDWQNLNGEWTYEFDFGMTGKERGLCKSTGFADKIIVPYAPECRLSGVQHPDFIPAMFYHRTLEIPTAWAGKRILLDFGAVDYLSEIYVDGELVLKHVGGSSAFTADITDFVTAGKTHNLVVYVESDVRSKAQPTGKQSDRFGAYGCVYSRTTGIWQTVTLECAGKHGLKSCHAVADFDGSSFAFTPVFWEEGRGYTLTIDVLAEGKSVGSATCPANSGITTVVAIPDARAWCPEDPFLYDIVYTVKDAKGTVIDRVLSYSGMRKIHAEGTKIYLNNKEFYFRQVLDQGFYPDGNWTSPSDADLQRDIEMSMACGFNSARLHQKIFEERFHYHADRLGYVTWAEFPSWGLALNNPDLDTENMFYVSACNFLREWAEVVQQQRNHPSIVAWTPLNETRPAVYNVPRFAVIMAQIYDLTKALDPTRLVNDACGYTHVKTDLFSVHSYVATGADLKNVLNKEDGTLAKCFPVNPEYNGKIPFLLTEFGGFKYVPEERRVASTGWGYCGLNLQTPAELLERIRDQVDYVLSDERIAGYCYTQLTDVEIEQNGLFCYDRTPKAPAADFAKVFGKNPPWLK